MKENQKFRKIYYYLGLSRVVVYVDYIPYETNEAKGRINNKHKGSNKHRR